MSDTDNVLSFSAREFRSFDGSRRRTGRDFYYALMPARPGWPTADVILIKPTEEVTS